MRLPVLTAAAALAFGLVSVAIARGIDYNAVATRGTVTVPPTLNPDPLFVQVPAGGPVDADYLGNLPSNWYATPANAASRACTGWITAGPTVRVNHQGGGPLHIFAVPSDDYWDFTLIINTPENKFICNDNFRGQNPGVVIERAAAGQYKVWVGLAWPWRPTQFPEGRLGLSRTRTTP